MTTITKTNKTVQPVSNKPTLAEIMQNNKTQFALCRYDERLGKLIMCHQFVQCRDFLNEAMVAVEENKELAIFGFKFGKDNPRPDPECTSLLVKLEGNHSLKNLQDNFTILKGIEEYLGWSVTYVEIVDNPEDKKNVTIWVMGDKRWSHCSLSMSLYTYILKCLTYQIKDKSQWKQEIAVCGTVESEYMNPEYIDHLINNLNDLLSRYTNYSGWKDQKNINVGTLHNNSGFHSLRTILNPKLANDFTLHYAKNIYKDHHVLWGWTA